MAEDSKTYLDTDITDPIYQQGRINKLFSDAVLVFNGIKYECHRIILSRCGYFVAFFANRNCWKKSKKQKLNNNGTPEYTITLSKVYSDETWNRLLDHIYDNSEELDCNCQQLTVHYMLEYYELCNELCYENGKEHIISHLEYSKKTIKDFVSIFDMLYKTDNSTEAIFGEYMYAMLREGKIDIHFYIDGEKESHITFINSYLSTGLIPMLTTWRDIPSALEYSLKYHKESDSYYVFSISSKDLHKWPIYLNYWMFTDLSKFEDKKTQLDKINLNGLESISLEIQDDGIVVKFELFKNNEIEALVFNVVIEDDDHVMRYKFILPKNRIHILRCEAGDLAFSPTYNYTIKAFPNQGHEHIFTLKRPTGKNSVNAMNIGVIKRAKDCDIGDSAFRKLYKKWLTEVCCWKIYEK